MKELYIAEVERIMAVLVDYGMPESVAYDIASSRAYGSMCERYADMADNARKRNKENGNA